METIVLKKNSDSERIPINAKKKIILNSRKGVHYKITMTNSSNTKGFAYHISESTVIDLEEENFPSEVLYIQIMSFGQKCVIEYSAE